MMQPLHADSRRGDAGFTYLEVLIAGTLVAVTMLGLTQMLLLGYSNVTSAGKMTMGLAAARQALEDIRELPYDNLINLHDFNTDNPGSVPSSGPEQEVARRWRYAVAGEGVGWTFTSDEKTRWTDLAAQGDTLGGVGTISVVQPTTTMTEVTVEVSVPGSWRNIELSTRISRL